MPDNEQRGGPGRREVDFEAAALRQQYLELHQLYTGLRIRVHVLEADLIKTKQVIEALYERLVR